jgi:hypothetical protein
VEQLEIKVFPDSGVEFNTHEQVVDPRVGEFAVFAVGREQVSFDEGEEGEEVAVAVGGDEKTTPVIVYEGGGEQAQADGDTKVKTVGNEPGKKTVDLIF